MYSVKYIYSLWQKSNVDNEAPCLDVNANHDGNSSESDGSDFEDIDEDIFHKANGEKVN